MENKKKKIYLIIAILIVLNLFLFFAIRFGRINDFLQTLPQGESKKAEVEVEDIPTGNVDVFNMDIQCECEDKEDCKTPSNIPVFNEKKDNKVYGKIFVDDNKGDYIYQNNLKIFSNVAFSYKNKIAPGVSNTYYFVAHNSTNSNLKYYVKMYEETEYNVNMKYRLKRNGKYVLGNNSSWVSADKLQTEFSKIAAKSSDVYQLEWKWFDSDEDDNLAGINMKEEYKLNIRFHFEEV